MKSGKIKKFLIYFIFLFFGGIFFFIFYSLSERKLHVLEKKNNFEVLASKLPVPPNTKKLDSYFILKDDFISVSSDYESDKSFQEVEYFYDKNLGNMPIIKVISNDKFYYKTIKYQNDIFLTITYIKADQRDESKTVYKISLLNKVFD